MANERLRYEVIVDASGAQRSVGALQRSLDGLGSGLGSSITGGLSGVQGAFSSLQGQVAGLAASFGAIQFGRGVLEVGQDFERVAGALRAATGTTQLAAAEMDFLRDVSNRLGLNLREVSGEYAKLANAARGTSLEGRGVRDVFESMSMAGRTFGLSGEQMRGAMNALQQMLSKGKVSAEELRGQLGERLPGAFQIAARAMGMTTQQLDRALEQGKIFATDFLPRFSAQLRREFGPESANAAQTLTANLARASTSWDEFRNNVFQSGFGQAMNEELQRGFSGLDAGAMRQLASTIGEGLGSAVRSLGDALRFVGEHADEFKAALVGVLAVGGTAAFLGMASGALGLAAALGPVGIGLGAAAAALFYYRDAEVTVCGETVHVRDLIVGAWDYIKVGVTQAVTDISAWVSVKVAATSTLFQSIGGAASSGIAVAIAVFREGMTAIWENMKARVEQMKSLFTGLISSVERLGAADFSGAGRALLSGGSSDPVTAANAASRARMQAAIEAAQRDGLGIGDLASRAGTALLGPGGSLLGPAASGAAASIASSAAAARNEREAADRVEAARRQAARDTEQRELEARRAADAERLRVLDADRARRAASERAGAGGNSAAERITEQIAQLRTQRDALQQVSAAHGQNEAAVREATAQMAAQLAVERLASTATAAQREQVRALTLEIERLKQANQLLTEAERERRQSRERGDRLVESHVEERQSLEALLGAYRSGGSDIEQRIEALGRERELRRSIANLNAEDAARVRSEATGTQALRTQVSRLRTEYDANKKFLTDLGEAGASAFESIVSGTKKAGTALRDLFGEFRKLALKRFVMDPILGAVGLGGSDSRGGGLTGWLAGRLTSLTGGSRSGISGASGASAAAADTATGTGAAAEAAGGGLFSGVGSALSGAWSWLGGLFGGARAGGGPVDGGSMYRVNEMGGKNPEWFVAPVGGRVVTHGQFEQALGGRGGGQKVTVHAPTYVTTPDVRGFRESEGQRAAKLRAVVGAGARYS